MTILEAIQQDRLAMSVAGALALANEAAVSSGVDPAKCLVNISEDIAPIGRKWRIQYGPRDYVNRRGGDLIVIVNPDASAVERVIRGQ
jgi:hypothetical protein